jgi:hypothetical protein
VIDKQVCDLGIDPQIVGALGAALFARERYAKLSPEENAA